MSEKKYNPHKNHRQRLFETIKEIGMDKVNDYLALEFILTYVIPRKDTNPLAHKLLEHYGSISAVLDSSVEELETIEGIGERSAKLLTMLPQIFSRYNISKTKNVKYLKTTQDMINFCSAFLKEKSVEELYAVYLDKSYKILGVKKVATGNVSVVEINKAKFLKETIMIKNVEFVVIAHCHLNGSCEPSKADKSSTNEIMEILSPIGIKLLDSIIICDGFGYSFSQLKKFEVQ